jgi:hypothetical protein
MTSYPLQATFSRGELSPRLHARIDIEHYRLGLAECINWIILRQGGLRRRSGTRYIASVRDHASQTRLLPFVFSTEQAYMLEFGDGYFRVFANGGVVEVSPGVPVEVATAYTADQVFDIQFTQSADVLYLVHRHHPPRKVERTGHTSWSISDIAFTDGPWLPQNDGATTLAPSAVSGPMTLTASATAGINGGDGFKATDVGRQIRFQASNGHWHWFVVTAFTDATHVTADYKGGINVSTTPETALTALPNTNARDTWRLGAWSETTGYPARIAFHEERLTLARTDHQPQTLWLSRSGDFESMRPGAADDDAITLTILAGQVNEIQWIAEAKALQIGTTGATRTVSAPDPDKPLTPGNLKQSRHTTFGTEAIQPVQVGPVTLFVGAYGRSLREFIYSLEADGFIAPDISILSEHVLRTGVRQLAYAQDPDAIVWLVAGDGQLVGMTYERDQKVVGFHRHRIAGGAADVFGAVESVATVPGAGGADETWLIVRRTVGGMTRRHIERLESAIESQAKADAFHVDCGLTYSGPPANEISGLDHLEGEMVAILADGAVDPPQLVDAGRIRLQDDRTATTVQVGLAFASVARTLPISTSGQDGALLGRRKRVQKVFLDLLETQGLKAGVAMDRLERATWRLPGDPMGVSPALFSGIAEVGIDDSWTNDGQVLLVADQPLPATVLSVMPALETEP